MGQKLIGALSAVVVFAGGPGHQVAACKRAEDHYRECCAPRPTFVTDPTTFCELKASIPCAIIQADGSCLNAPYH